jgi:hypothetical protein
MRDNVLNLNLVLLMSFVNGCIPKSFAEIWIISHTYKSLYMIIVHSFSDC